MLKLKKWISLLLAVAMVICLVPPVRVNAEDTDSQAATEATVVPEETETQETEAQETESQETEVQETESQETEPQETESGETEPEETEPEETEPEETEPEADLPYIDIEDGLSEEEYNQRKQAYRDGILAGRPMVMSTVNGNLLSNEYIEFAMDPTNAHFTVGTTAGNPDLTTDNHKLMLFGHSDPWSSYTTVRVDGTNYVYGDGGMGMYPYFSGNSSISEDTFGNIRVRQIVSIVRNSATMREDVIEVKYIATNTGSSAASFGLRIMLDTMLGDNDAAPFRIPGVGDVTTEKEFSGSSIPQYWQAFDSLSNPKVVSYGNFVSGAIRPNKVQFTNWSRVYNTPWGYTVQPGASNGDSAVSVIWERTLAPGAQETYVTRYGLSELVQDLQPPLGLTIASDASVQIDEQANTYMPYTITAYVQNVGTATAINATCQIELPSCLDFVDPAETGLVQLGNMAVGQLITVEKQVYVKNPPTAPISTRFGITVKADNALSKTLMRPVNIEPLPFMDSDGDGLPDSWEINGADVNGDGVVDVHIEQMGADPTVPDLFVEVDWMYQPEKTAQVFGRTVVTQAEISLRPSENAMRMVYQQFKNHGINLHIDAGPASTDYVTGNRWGSLSGGNPLTYTKNTNLGSYPNYNNWNSMARTNFNENRQRIFRYCMFINKYNGTFSSGLANGIPGQYFVVADVNGGVSGRGDLAVAGTFMHEMGHTLGLSHGGITPTGQNDHTHYKPNYLSIMNYNFQFSGLVGVSGVTALNYSEYSLPAIDERSINENTGVDPGRLTAGTGLGTKWYQGTRATYGSIAGNPVDFNANSAYDTGLRFDLTDCDGTGVLLAVTNDWQHLKFTGGAIGAHGADLSAGLDFTIDGEMIPVDGEISVPEAIENGLFGNPGDCKIFSVTPGRFYAGIDGQTISVEVINLNTADTTAQLKVSSSLLEETLEQTVSLGSSADADGRYVATIPVPQNAAPGTYSVSCELKRENGTLDTKTVTVTIGEPVITAVTLGETAELVEGVQWTVENEAVGTVDGHVFTPVALGGTYVYGTTEDGATIVCYIHVLDSAYAILLDTEAAAELNTVWANGKEYPVDRSGDPFRVRLEEAPAELMVTYTWHIGDANDVHSQYPVGMQVWKLSTDEGRVYTARCVQELEDILQYSGSSIRITGVKGIRMITSITRDNKTALTGSEGLGGYTLVEYGTALCFASDLEGGKPLVLGQDYTRSNYAYRKGVADPVFAYTDNLMQYTNVLVGFNNDQCKDDIAMRPYMILQNADGEQVTIYGGIVYRSIGYIAWQNRSVFEPGTAAYEYVWDIIHYVYGDRYDEDYEQ